MVLWPLFGEEAWVGSQQRDAMKRSIDIVMGRVAEPDAVPVAGV